MFISQNDYDALVNKTVATETALKCAQDEVSTLKTKLANIQDDYETKLKKKDNELELDVYEKTKELRNANDGLRIENNKLKAETDILKKAFENMGFDVKDMKEILNKLVDGIVSKNTVQLVK